MKMIVGVAFLAAGMMSVAQADDEWHEPDYPLKGWYAGGDLGGWRFTDPVSRISVTGFTYSPFVGYQFNRYLGTEGAYIGGNDAGTSISGVDFILHAHVAEASLIGSLPLTGYAGLYARAGVAKWWATSTVSYQDLSGTASDNGTNGVYGAGVYEHFDVVASRLEWTRANIQGTRENRFSVAAYWRF
jgi:opacity protein-like surface antigen